MSHVVDNDPLDADSRRGTDQWIQRQIACLPNLSAEQIGELVRELDAARTEFQRQNVELRNKQPRGEESRDLASVSPAPADQLLQEQSLLDNVLRATDVMLALLDPQFTFVWVNAAYAEACRRKPEELIGKNHFVLYPDTENEEIFRKVRETGEGTFHKDKPFVFPDQPERGVTYWDWSLTPVNDAGGTVTSLVFSLRETTRFKRAEQSLRESEERLRLATKATNDVVWDWDIVHNSQRWNEAGTAVFGWSDIVEHPQTDAWWLERIHPEDRKQVEEGFLAVFENRDRDHWQDEYRFLKRDGTYAFVLDRGYVMRDEQGNPVRMIGAMLDLTARKQTEDSLRLSEGRLALAASGTRIGMFEWNIATGEILCTEQHAQLLGLSVSSSSPSSSATTLSLPCHYSDWAERVHPDDLRRVESDVCRCIIERTPLETEYRVVWPDGGLHWIISRGLLQHDDQGRPQRMLGIVMDITERKRAEAAMRESEERFRALVTASSAVLYRMSPDWSEMRQLHSRGFLADTERPNRTWLEQYIYPDDQARVIAVVNESIRTKSIFELEHRVRRVDGGEGWTFSRAVPLMDAHGEIVEWFGAASDITERKRAEEQLKAVNETLEQRVAQRTAELHWRTSQLQQLAAQMTQTEERERRRLAQILHDHLQQMLVAAKIKLSLASRCVLEERAGVAIGEALTLVDEAISESRSLTKELSPPILYDAGLAAALEWLDERRRTNIICQLRCS